jgi:potassium efflux system protein
MRLPKLLNASVYRPRNRIRTVRPGPVALLCLLLLLGVLGPVWAQPAAELFQRVTEKGQAQIKELEGRLQQQLSLGQIDQAWQLGASLRKDAKECVAARTSAQEGLTRDLGLLGPVLKGEEDSVRKTRAGLEKDKAKVEQELAACRLVLVKIEDVLGRLEQRRIEAQAAQLLGRTPSVFEQLGDVELHVQSLRPVLGLLHLGPLGFDLLGPEGWSIWGLVSVLGFGIAVLVWQWARGYVEHHPRPADMTAQTGVALARSVARYGMLLMPLLGWSLFWLGVSWMEGRWVPNAGMSLVLLGYFGFLLAVQTFLAPLPPARYFLPFDEGAARRLAHSLRFLALVALVGMLTFLAPLDQQVPPPFVALARLVFASLYVAALAWLVWNFFSIRGKRRLGLGRGLFWLALLVGLGSEIAGYRNLSEYLLVGISATLAALGVGWLVASLGSDFCDSLDTGRYQWERRLRGLIGVQEGEYLPGVFWLRLLVTVGVWVVVGLGLVRVWRVSPWDRARFLGYLTEGFQVGSVTIVPGRLVFALVLVALLMSAISWLKKQLEERWLRKSRIDAGGRNAVVTVTGYAAGAMAILIALSVAGVDFSNLALIAGALSVGIGFGLQNIVNNFVSGLILLFERPIRKGDWIVVGNTEGHVQDISIRSTQIRTFERADVIVPNSELISSQVTNWMLRDLIGRVRVPIGVAYGSDVQLVKKLLLEIGERHPMAILDGTVSRPWVLFLGFGESALNFELRFFIRNVDQRLSVLSDINFAIDRAFRENGIEIPFPQRDLHLRSLPPGFGGSGKADSGEEA